MATTNRVNELIVWVVEMVGRWYSQLCHQSFWRGSEVVESGEFMGVGFVVVLVSCCCYDRVVVVDFNCM